MHVAHNANNAGLFVCIFFVCHRGYVQYGQSVLYVAYTVVPLCSLRSLQYYPPCDTPIVLRLTPANCSLPLTSYLEQYRTK
jgi:hypothetical protein